MYSDVPSILNYAGVQEQHIQTQPNYFNVSWAAYHADRVKDSQVTRGKSGLLPLFEESSE